MELAANLAAVLVLLLGSAQAGDASPAELSQVQLASLLDDGLAAFDRGAALAKRSPQEARTAFCEAADQFQQIVDAGLENGQLYYNLGNARLKCGQTGLAIADYLRARKLTPGDARLKENLAYARSLCRYNIPDSGRRAAARTIFFWHYDTPLRTRLLAGLTAYLLFWLCMIARMLVRRIRWTYPAAACLVIWVTLGISVGLDLRHQAAHHEGVIIANDVVVRKGNAVDYDPQFEQTLSEGVEFEVVEQRGSWLHVRLADGNEGWIQHNQAEII